MVGRGLTKNPRNPLKALWYPKSKNSSCPRSCPSRLSRRPRRFFRAVFLHSSMPGRGRRVSRSVANLRSRSPSGRMRPATFEQSNLEFSQKRALPPVHHRRINSLRHNDGGSLTRSFTAALYGNVLDPYLSAARPEPLCSPRDSSLRSTSK
jgi:hypothetical protein